MDRDQVQLALLRAFDEDGPRGVLRWLNARTGHRFTGMFRFDDPMLRNIALYDRENPHLEIGVDAPLDHTYCSIVGETQAPYATADARAEPDLASHPARDSTISYAGVLLRDEEGEPFGSLCHFDLRPQDVPHADIPLMQRAAELLSASLRSTT